MIVYQESRGICFGFCDGSLRDFLAEYLRFAASRSILVTCIDSSPKPARSPKWLQLLQGAGVEYELFGDFVWIPESDVARVINSRQIFPGFDEIYFLERKPSTVPHSLGRITSDGVNFGDGLPERLVLDLASLGADRCLADGCGLNFAMEAGSAKALLGTSPSPSSA